MPGLTASYIWLNGRLVPSEVAHVSVYDRGFQLGDGVFEALRARRGVAIELDGHLARLHESLRSMGFEIPFEDDEIRAGMDELLAAEGLDEVEPMDAPATATGPEGPAGAGGHAGGVGGHAGGSAGGTAGGTSVGPGRSGGSAGEPRPGDAVIRLTVSRGFDPTRSVLPASDAVATVAIQAWPFTPPSARAIEHGERLITSAVRRAPESPTAGIKTISRADLVYARLEADRAGADDAIFLTTDGLITEATTSNVLLIKGTTCATPALGTGLLAGTTRAWLVGHGAVVGLEMVQRDLRLEDAFDADEMAICASIGGVIPVTSLDGHLIGDGRPGPRTIAMREARERWIDEVSIEGARTRRSRGL